jgi:hypothetical protein
MNAEEFVNKLASIKPSVDRLVTYGYSVERAKEIQSQYILRKKTCTTPIIYNDPVVNLINEYDTSILEIGNLALGKGGYSFLPPNGVIHIGSIESDILVINPKTGFIELLDHEQPDFVMARCASSGDKLLDALFLLMSHERPNADLFSDLTEKQRKENNRAAGLRAKECAKAAGVFSDKVNIYELLLGYDSRL